MRPHSLSMKVERYGTLWTVTWKGSAYTAASWHEAYFAAVAAEANRGR
jgi:hypothetical protein